jgi:hypothetical protein
MAEKFNEILSTVCLISQLLLRVDLLNEVEKLIFSLFV